jgi:hypothetical protein
MDRIGKDSERASKRIESSFSRLKTQLGIGLSIAGITAFVKSSIDAADRLNDISKITGQTVEQVAALSVAAKQSGTDLEQASKGVLLFSKLVVEASGGSEEAGRKIQALGLNLKALKDKSPEERLIALAGALEKFAREDRGVIVAEILGNRMAALAPLVADGSKELRGMLAAGKDAATGLAAAAREADQFNDEMVLLQTKLQSVIGLFVQAGAGWVKLFDGTEDKRKRIQELAGEISNLQKSLQTGIVTGGETGKAWLDAIIPDMKMSPQIRQRMASNVEIRRAEIAKLQGELIKIPAGGGAAPDAAARAICIANGGKWDGKKCVEAPKKTGRQETAAERRMETLREGAKELEAELEKLAADTAFQVEVDNSYADALKDAADEQKAMRDATKETREALQDAIDPTARWVRELERLEKLKGTPGIDPELIDAVIFKTHEQIDAATELNGEMKKTVDIADEVSHAMTGAFADAIIDGQKFSDVLRGLNKDLLRIVANNVLLKPLGEAISKRISSSGVGDALGKIFGSIFGAGKAQGGALPGYGGGDRRLILAEDGEFVIRKEAVRHFGARMMERINRMDIGRRAEGGLVQPGAAFMPRGTALAGGGVTVNMVINTPDFNSFRASRNQLLTDMQLAMRKAQRNL